MLDHPLASNISDLMRKLPLGSLFFQRKPTAPTPVTAAPRPPRTQPNIATPTPMVRTTATTTPATTTPTPPAPVTDAQRYVTPTVPPHRTTPSTTPRPRMTPSKRRRQIQFAFELLGTPPEWIIPAAGDEPVNQWGGKDGVIQLIANYLLWETTWRTKKMIRRVITFVREKIDSGEDLDVIDAGPKIGAHRSGRHRKMTPEQDKIVARCLQRGYGLEMTHSIVSQKLAPLEVSIETVRRSAKRAYGGKCHNRGTKKTGCKDKKSKWATARMGFALQLSEQFREDTPGFSMIGNRVCREFEGEWYVGIITRWDDKEDLYFVEYDDGDKEDLEFNELRVPEWKSIPRNGVFWIDEKHKKIHIGRSNRYEWLFYVNPNDPTQLMRKEDGGVLEQEMPCTVGKFMGECRGAFGVMQKVGVDGRLEGHRMTPFNYTNQKVVGPVAYQKAFDAEVHRVNTLKTTGTSRSVYWKESGEGLTGGAYEARYGDRWCEEVKATLGRGGNALCCVTDIMDHVIKEGNRFVTDRCGCPAVFVFPCLSLF